MTLGTVEDQRILVTGGNGLIGGAVVQHLVELGARVTVIDKAATDSDPRVHYLGAEKFVALSITDMDSVRVAMSGCDAVVHAAGLAGLDQGAPEEIYATNALGTFTVMEAAGQVGVAKLVYASSINACGLPLSSQPVLPTRYPWDEDEPVAISDAYSLSKQANEAAAVALSRRHALPMTGLRYPLVRDITVQDGAVFAHHIRRGLREDPRRQACEGWTYLDVRDAARATVAALQSDTPAAPGILIAADRTYLRQATDDALNRFAPDVPRATIPGRQVPICLDRATTQLSFKAMLALEDLDPNLLADLDEIPA